MYVIKYIENWVLSCPRDKVKRKSRNLTINVNSFSTVCTKIVRKNSFLSLARICSNFLLFLRRRENFCLQQNFNFLFNVKVVHDFVRAWQVPSRRGLELMSSLRSTVRRSNQRASQPCRYCLLIGRLLYRAPYTTQLVLSEWSKQRSGACCDCRGECVCVEWRLGSTLCRRMCVQRQVASVTQLDRQICQARHITSGSPRQKT